MPKPIPRVNHAAAPSVPSGHWHLVHDPSDGEDDWSLFKGIKLCDRMVVDWRGKRPAKQTFYKKPGFHPAFNHYRITKSQADTCAMAAMALSREGWYRFAQRLVNGGTTCSSASAPPSPR